MSAVASGIRPAEFRRILLEKHSNTMLPQDSADRPFSSGLHAGAFAVFQISAVFWPPNAIKYFGGPAELSQTRPVIYTLLCVMVAASVAEMGLYALSGAGKIRRLPLLRTVITAIAVIYVLRGLLLVPQMPIVIKNPGLMRFALFSVTSLCLGIVHLGGLIKLFRHGRSGEAASKS